MKNICKIATCGDVDSGKSTLIGRMLVTNGLVYLDQLEDLNKASALYGKSGRLEYGLLFDGLQAEREQQITIDIAHRFFDIGDTRFHLMDCPGHPQYTHNFVIAAADADIALLVVDATKGIMPQTLAHLDICRLFRVPRIIVAVTKKDAVSGMALDAVARECRRLAPEARVIITCAIAQASEGMAELTETLLSYASETTEDEAPFVLHVQSAKLRTGVRYYSGMVHGRTPSGAFQASVFPGGFRCGVSAVDGQVDAFVVDRNIDIGRGFTVTTGRPHIGTTLKGRFVRFKEGFGRLLFKYGTSTVRVHRVQDHRLELEAPVTYFSVDECRRLGCGLLIDESTGLNAGCFIISGKAEEVEPTCRCWWFTGLSGSGKSTLGSAFISTFQTRPVLLDGDEIRRTVNYDVGLDDAGRDANVRKIANLARLLLDQGFDVVVTCISKDLRQREYARKLLGGAYTEVYVESSEQTRRQRDTKGLYAAGVSALADYERSPWNHIVVNTDTDSVDQSVAKLVLRTGRG